MHVSDGSTWASLAATPGEASHLQRLKSEVLDMLVELDGRTAGELTGSGE